MRLRAVESREMRQIDEWLFLVGNLCIKAPMRLTKARLQPGKGAELLVCASQGGKALGAIGCCKLLSLV